MNDKYGQNIWKDWNLSAKDLINKTKQFIDHSRQKNAYISKLNPSNKNDYRKFLPILADDITECCTFHNMCSYLQFIGKTKEIRDAGHIVDTMMTKYLVEVDSNIDLFRVIVQFYKIAKKDKYFIYDDRRFIKKIIKKYVRGGINLSDKNRQLLLRIKQEICKIENYIRICIRKENSKVYG